MQLKEERTINQNILKCSASSALMTMGYISSPYSSKMMGREEQNKNLIVLVLHENFFLLSVLATFYSLLFFLSDNSGTVNRIMMTTNNPEDWLCFLLRLEKKGIPQMDLSILNRLIGRYSQAVTALPAEKHSEDENYARILVRFAELKA